MRQIDYVSTTALTPINLTHSMVAVDLKNLYR